MWNLRERNEDNSWWPEEYDKAVLRVAFFLHWPSTRFSDGSKNQLHQGMSTIWSSCSLHNVLTLTISPLLHLLFESWCLRWRQHSVLSTALLASTWIIASAVGFSMTPKSMILWGPGSLRIAKSFVTCRLFDMPNMLEHWLAHMVTFIVGLQPGKSSINAWWKSMLLPKVWLSDCVISRSTRFWFWASLAPYVLPTMPPSKPRIMPFSVPQQDRTTLSPSSLLQVGSICGLGPDLIGIHSISLAARYRVAACSSTLRRGLEKVNDVRGHNCTPLFALSPAWERDFLFPSMTFHTANALDIVCRLDRNDTLDEVSQNDKQKVATGLLLSKLRTQDFARPLSSRASRVLGPISRHRIVDILPHMKKVSRACRPGLLVGFLRILCNGLCTARRFHTAEHDHTCCIGCPDEPDSLTHYNVCPRLYKIFLSFWRHATVLPPRNCLLHDLISRVFLWSLQYGVVVQGFFDAFCLCPS